VLLGNPETQALLLQILQQHDAYAPVPPQLLQYDNLHAWRQHSEPCDALLIDAHSLVAPELGVLKKVLASAPGIPVIVLAETPEHASALAALRLGATDVIDKADLSTCRLGKTIEFAIQRSRCNQQQREVDHQTAQSHKLESLNRLSSGVAHQLNTPLQYLMDNVEFLGEFWARIAELISACEQDLDDRDMLRWQQHRAELKRVADGVRFDYFRQQVPLAIEECQHGLAHVSHVVSTMQDFAVSANVGSDSRSMQQVNLNQIVEEVVATAHNRCSGVAEVRLELDAQLPRITACAPQIHRALYNLMLNAVDAIQEQAGRQALGQIVIRTSQHSQSVRLEVEDSGQGIMIATQGQVFDPFFSTKEVGAGQGLTVVQNIITKRHGGQVTFQSEPGVGTTFRIEFPAMQADRDPRDPLLALPAAIKIPVVPLSAFPA
jgi:signal transduction histidine kinase